MNGVEGMSGSPSSSVPFLSKLYSLAQQSKPRQASRSNFL
jgi:hypothetical protein